MKLKHACNLQLFCAGLLPSQCLSSEQHGQTAEKVSTPSEDIQFKKSYSIPFFLMLISQQNDDNVYFSDKQ